MSKCNICDQDYNTLCVNGETICSNCISQGFASLTAANIKLKAKIEGHEANIKLRADHVEKLQAQLKLSVSKDTYDQLHIDFVGRGVELTEANNGRLSLQESLAMTEALLVEVEARLTKHDWVSVEDRSPVKNKKVIEEFQVLKAGLIMQCSYNFDKGDWSCPLMERTVLTHWKPIVLPKEAYNDTR